MHYKKLLFNKCVTWIIKCGSFCSILVSSLDWSRVKPNLPWLVDAGGCVLLDAFVSIHINVSLYGLIMSSTLDRIAETISCLNSSFLHDFPTVYILNIIQILTQFIYFRCRTPEVQETKDGNFNAA